MRSVQGSHKSCNRPLGSICGRIQLESLSGNCVNTKLSLRSASLLHGPILCGHPKGRAMVAHGNGLVKEQDFAGTVDSRGCQDKWAARLSVNSQRQPQNLSGFCPPLAHKSKAIHLIPNIPPNLGSNNNTYAPPPTNYCRSGETGGRRTNSCPSRSAERQPKGSAVA